MAWAQESYCRSWSLESVCWGKCLVVCWILIIFTEHSRRDGCTSDSKTPILVGFIRERIGVASSKTNPIFISIARNDGKPRNLNQIVSRQWNFWILIQIIFLYKLSLLWLLLNYWDERYLTILKWFWFVNCCIWCNYAQN